jgi:hypothetical protein
MIALGLVFAVLLGLLTSLTAGIRGVLTGRQRSTATSIANQVMETARARSYAEVGHDLDSDPTLAGDGALSGSAPNYLYTGLGPGSDEPLAGSIVDAGPAAGSTSNPLYPFSPHQWQTTREATTYTTSVYVTQVTPPTGDPYKRISVTVSWNRSLDAPSAVPPVVKISSYVFDALRPPDPLLEGGADADAGRVTVTGQLSGIALSDFRFFFPYAHGEIESRFVRQAKGFAGTARAQGNLASGSVSGCSVSNEGRTAECTGAKAETASDNDSATAPPDHNTAGPLSDSGGTVAMGSQLTFSLGSGTVRSLSTARSCWSCYGAGNDDDDRLPYQFSEATGPASLALAFSTGPVAGSLLAATSACSPACAATTLDRDDQGSVSRLLSTATLSHPSLDLARIDSAPPGYGGMVRIGATNLITSAHAGPGAVAPSATGSTVSVQLYDTSVAPGYRTVSITPGIASDHTSHAEMAINGALVVMDATVHSAPAAVWSTSSGGSVGHAEASLTSWLWVEIHLVVTDASGVLADLVVHVDYGRASARAEYQPA